MTGPATPGSAPNRAPDLPPGGLRFSESPTPQDAPDDPGVVTIRRFLAALDAGDRNTARSLLADQVVWVVPGRSRVAGTHRGPDDILSVDETMRELSGGTLRHQVMIRLASPPHAHAVTRQSATRDGVDGHFDRAIVFTLADGSITEIHAYTDDLYAFDDFWR